MRDITVYDKTAKRTYRAQCGWDGKNKTGEAVIRVFYHPSQLGVNRRIIKITETKYRELQRTHKVLGVD